MAERLTLKQLGGASTAFDNQCNTPTFGFTNSRDKCHWHNNRHTERYKRKEYNTKGHPTEMDSTPAKVS
ncbi:hypothetical protein PIB30_064979 [Stylosanthes scabra]|uniref:Uncharacterized protein n=1 Tax=Stylosanthes scabra TaxID=79078 RepID=A0ABU6YJF2_9FABA|nr:hypothetical protein [Stylosanthes scabra]